MAKWGAFTFEGEEVLPGTRHEASLQVGNDPLGQSAGIPVHVIHGANPGPCVAVTAAIHGDELNGTGIIHRLVYGDDHLADTKDDHVDPSSLAGTLLLVPVVNVEAMMMGTRNSPDGRDMNRLFPGKKTGNQSQRIAEAVFSRIIKRADYHIDLHTAPQSRVNVPQIRADLSNSTCKRLARAFGTEVVMGSQGPEGSIRRAALDAGIPSILFECGTSHRFEPKALTTGVRGILNVLAELEMLERSKTKPMWRVLVKQFRWIRAPEGGMLHLLIEEGALVKEGDAIAHLTDPFGARVDTVISPVNGLVVGLATTPLVRPGDPIANVVYVREKKMLEIIEKDTKAGLPPRREDAKVQEATIEDENGATLDETERSAS